MNGLVDESGLAIRIDPREETIPVRDWNAWLEKIGRTRPVRFRIDSRSRFRPPWNVSLRWNVQFERWEANLEPGFVNGLDAETRLAAEIAPKASLLRLKTETGETPEGKIYSRLTEFPWVPLSPQNWRAIGTDALGTELEPVPRFFQALGVGDGQRLEIDPFGVTVHESEGVPGGPRRLLRAQEVVLTQDRATVTAGIGIEADGTAFDWTITPANRERAYVDFRIEFQPATQASLAEQIAGEIVDDPFDRLNLATVYLLSPDGAQDGAEPDQDWSPFVKHNVFWNLNYEISVDLRVSDQFPPMFLPVPLAGGVGQPLIDSIVDIASDQANAVLRLLNQSQIRGKFWIV